MSGGVQSGGGGREKERSLVGLNLEGPDPEGVFRQTDIDEKRELKDLRFRQKKDVP